MFERFTDRARRVVVLGKKARLLHHNYIGTEHLLLGLIHEGDGVAARALEVCGVTLEEVRTGVSALVKSGSFTPSGHIPFTPRAKAVLELSLREALQLGHDHIGTEHILLGLLREGEGVAAQVLAALGVEFNQVRVAVTEILGGGTPEPQPRSARSTAPTEARRPTIRRADIAADRGPRPATCAFCGAPSTLSGALYTGVGNALICVNCARVVASQAIAVGAMRNTQAWVPPPLTISDRVAAVVATGPPPPDENAARAEIESALLNLTERTPDGRGLVNVHEGDDLGACATEAERRVPPSARVVTVVNSVAFVSATEGVAWSTTLLGGRPVGGLIQRESRVVLVDGRWLVTRATACEWFAVAGVQCPPRDDTSRDDPSPDA